MIKHLFRNSSINWMILWIVVMGLFVYTATHAIKEKPCVATVSVEEICKNVKSHD